MSNKKSWEEIKSAYPDEWVELVDFEWNDSEPYPRSGIVRVHHRDKKMLKTILNSKDRPTEAALLFTGENLLPQVGLFSANLHQFIKPS